MNEAEWAACAETKPMLTWLEPRASPRKLRLVAAACARRVWSHLTDPRLRRLVESAERLADGLMSRDEAEVLLDATEALIDEDVDVDRWPPSRSFAGVARVALGSGSAWVGARCAARGVASLTGQEEGPDWLAALHAEEAAQCELVREIFGSPSRPFRFDPIWLAGEGRPARELARDVDHSGRYEDLSMLADALERCGCPDRAAIDHLRGPGVHVRGCWVIDALLGREPAVREGLTTSMAWRECEDLELMLHVLDKEGSMRRRRLFALACCRRIDHLIHDERCRRAIAMASRYAAGVADEDEMEQARAIAEQAWSDAKYNHWVAEAEENFCLTPRQATFGRDLFIANAVVCAVAQDPRRPAGEIDIDRPESYMQAHEWTLSTLRYQIYAGMSDGQKWHSRSIVEAVARVERTEGRALCEVLRDLFGDVLGHTGEEPAWLPVGWMRSGEKSEAWCILPAPLRIDLGAGWMSWRDGSIPGLARAIYEQERFDRLPELADLLVEAGCTEPAILDHLRGPGPHIRGCWALDRLISRPS